MLMTYLAIASIALFVWIKSKSASKYYRTFGFKNSSPYEGVKEYSMKRTSWLTKSKYIGWNYEFWWSPGGGFGQDLLRKCIGSILLLGSVYLSFYAPVFVLWYMVIILMLSWFIS